MVGVPFQFVVIACIGYLYGLPDTRRPFLVLALSTTANLVLELILVFGLDWGIAGSAWGTVFAQMLSAAIFLAIVVPSLRADGLHRLSVVPSVMWAVLKVGAHLVQRTAFLLAALAVATAAASQVGHHRAGRPPDRRPAVPVPRHRRRHVQGVGPVAGGPRPGRGPAGRGARRRAATSTAGPGGPGCCSPWSPWRWRRCSRTLFTGDPDVVRVATIAMVVLAVMQLPAAFTFVLDGVLMGANDFRDLRWQTTLAFAVSLPVFVAVLRLAVARDRHRVARPAAVDLASGR